MIAVVKKTGRLLLATVLIGYSVCFQPTGRYGLPDTNRNNHYAMTQIFPAIVQRETLIQIKDANGNLFQMRLLNPTQFPKVLKGTLQEDNTTNCREYIYGGAKWYEWCTLEAEGWVLYRWQEGEKIQRCII